MSKAKLTYAAEEATAYEKAFELAEIKVLQVEKVAKFHKVEISYKTEQQILNAGIFVATLNSNEITLEEPKTGKRQKQNKN